MKKIILIFFISFQFSFSVTIPTNYGGTIISLKEFQQFEDYCFYTNSFILESTYDLPYDKLDYNYRLYDSTDGQIVLGFGELVLHCYTEQAAISTFGNTSVMNHKFQSTLKRGRTDRCLGLDWFDGFWNIYGCLPETGEWYVIQNSVGGTANDSSGTYECYNPSTDKFFAGSSFLNLVESKLKIFGVEYNDIYYYRTFNCLENSNDVALNPTLTQLKAGLTTSQTSSDIPSSGGSSGGTSTNNTEITTKLDTIESDLQEVKNQTSSTQTTVLGRISDVENSILLQNENIAVSKADLKAKLETIEAKTDNLQSEIKAKIELEKENLKKDLIANDELKTNEIKEKIDSLNNQLTSLNSSTTDEIVALNDSISLYQSENVDSKNQILSSLSALQSQIDNISTSSNNGTPTDNTDVVDTLNSGFSNLNQSVNNGLVDGNNKPFLQSINENLINQNSPLDDVSQSGSEVNNLVSNELNYALNKYNNLFGSGYCSAPTNITVTLFGTTFTLVDFRVLDSSVDYIRSLFLTMAYLIGLFLFLKVK